MKNLAIYEIDYSVSPGGVNSFEVYDELTNDTPIFESESLEEACRFCYTKGYNFNVFTLAEWERSNTIPLKGARW